MLPAENKSEERIQELNKAIDDFSLFDDDFMSVVFDRNIEATEFLLNTILERDDMNVIEVIGQREYKNPVIGFKELHESYVIFITKNDVMGSGLPLYHIDRVVKETGISFEDGSHIIYVNGSYQNEDDPIGKLVHDFNCKESEDVFYPILAKQIHYFKETEGGRATMCKAVEELAEKWAEESRLDDIRNLMESMQWTVEQAMDALRISEEDRVILLKRF